VGHTRIPGVRPSDEQGARKSPDRAGEARQGPLSRACPPDISGTGMSVSRANKEAEVNGRRSRCRSAPETAAGRRGNPCRDSGHVPRGDGLCGRGSRVGGRRGCLAAPSPPPPSEPCARVSRYTALQSPLEDASGPGRLSACRVPPGPGIGRPHPLRHVGGFPVLGLLRGLRRLGAASHRDSYPVGDLALRYHATYRARFRSPTHPVKRVHVPECCTGRSCRPPDAYGRHPMHAASEPT
jgi:hypothetical protein